MRLHVRGVLGGWPAPVARRAPRLFRIDPRVLLGELTADDAEAFRATMSILHVGDTIKITGTNRHAAADALLLDHVRLEGASIVDIGASDGSTSMDLLAKLPADIASFVIADLYLSIDTVDLGHHVLFFDATGQCILVAGKRLMSWPSLSRPVRALSAPLVRRARGRTRTPVLLLGPATRARMASDPRVTARVHDVFQPWPAPAPDVIKVANLLRRLYFSDDDIRRAVSALLQSLDEGGHFLVLDNPRIEGIDLRAGLYRRTDGRFELVAETEHTPEIADIITTVALADTTTAD